MQSHVCRSPVREQARKRSHRAGTRVCEPACQVFSERNKILARDHTHLQ